MRLLGLPEGGAKLRRQRSPDSSECCRISEKTTLHVGGAGTPKRDRDRLERNVHRL